MSCGCTHNTFCTDAMFINKREDDRYNYLREAIKVDREAAFKALKKYQAAARVRRGHRDKVLGRNGT